MIITAKYRHGSVDSTDIDVHYVTWAKPTREEARVFLEGLAGNGENPNVIFIENGEVVWTYKGPVDEVHNALLATYHHHDQNYCLTIVEKVHRFVGVKAVRVVRGILGKYTRGTMRTQIKEALRSNVWATRIAGLRMIADNIEDFGTDHDRVEVFKFLAFQMGQLEALFNGVEVYDKNHMRCCFARYDSYLDREPGASGQVLSGYLNMLIDDIEIRSRDLGEGVVAFPDFLELTGIKTETNIEFTITGIQQ